ncbi:TIGR03885 family FMN-dependent LLM class oxidoreductase [Tautonia plasticadhaerens]|uniref:F420-dependent glucose-6-phosphate dehydrogenase n=1 Tax=Tautonia plasticadhaerens TaxID=2527974 RepID=A0A518HC19_9BACT|nr:TIGR03885 family FMN-dependent LLM class oxidoreductase [Tautonia plasticadhaerens]QDV38395.1 F420-dependent glucose-6-phosphate dehydrogenase [Tautonia plasticadhaerens]
MTIGFHCSHELFPPDRLLDLARRAERAGFHAAMCSDHFNPWTERQGESGFAWSWLGAAMQATSLPFGVVNAPGQRYHPAIVAQAAATLSLMFPGRFWVALGTGQNLNEHITGDPWPPKDRRRARLRESVDVIRALWAGETVNHDGLVRLRDARLYTRPETPPPIYGAALTPETAEWVGSWADGLITVSGPRDAQCKIIDAFRRGGGAGKPVAEQVALSWADTEAEALRAARRNWPVAAVDLGKNQDLPLPSDFDRETAHLSPEGMADLIRVSSDLDRHAEWLRADSELGVDAVYLHPVGPDPASFIDAFADRVLPALG